MCHRQRAKTAMPFADEGPPTSVNLELRCRAHNAYEAQLWFGAWR